MSDGGSLDQRVDVHGAGIESAGVDVIGSRYDRLSGDRDRSGTGFPIRVHYDELRVLPPASVVGPEDVDRTGFESRVIVFGSQDERDVVDEGDTASETVRLNAVRRCDTL